MPLPGAWTDDMSVTVAPEHTLDELVEFVLDSERRGAQRSQIMQTLTNTFGLSFADARLAWDRVRGGQVRAATPYLSNEPDPAKDPVAYISYHRARGAPPPATRSAETGAWRELIAKVGRGDLADALAYATSPEFTRSARPHEREAATLWHRALVPTEGTQPSPTSSAVGHVLALADAMANARLDVTLVGNVLMQAGAGIATVAESRIDELGGEPSVQPGTLAWFDAIKLDEAARRLSTMLLSIGDGSLELAALNLRARITARLMGRSRDRVGIPMMDAARCERRVGQAERAASLCNAIIADFLWSVEQCESYAEAPLDEDEIALRSLVDAIDMLAEIQGANDSGVEKLRSRCSALLERSVGEQ